MSQLVAPYSSPYSTPLMIVTVNKNLDTDNHPKSVRLRGLFIWAIDQDTDDHEMLAAVLGDKGLGYFGGVGSDSDWTSFSTSGCEWSSEYSSWVPWNTRQSLNIHAAMQLTAPFRMRYSLWQGPATCHICPLPRWGRQGKKAALLPPRWRARPGLLFVASRPALQFHRLCFRARKPLPE